MTISLGGYTDIALSDLIVEIFFAAYKSSKFIPREEPLLDIYTCYFSRANLSSNYYTPEAIYAAYTKEINKITKEVFKSYLLPLELPCSYYI